MFPQPLNDFLIATGTSCEQLQGWHTRKWLSFQPEAECLYDAWHYEEVMFIKALADSGIGELVIEHLLDKLAAPYQYPALSTAYCFGREQWVRVRGEPDIGQIIDENFDSWLSDLAEAGDTNRLMDVSERLSDLLDPTPQDEESKECSHD